MSSLARTHVLVWQWVCGGAGLVALGCTDSPCLLSTSHPGNLLRACFLLVAIAPSLTTSAQVANPNLALLQPVALDSSSLVLAVPVCTRPYWPSFPGGSPGSQPSTGSGKPLKGKAPGVSS